MKFASLIILTTHAGVALMPSLRKLFHFFFKCKLEYSNLRSLAYTSSPYHSTHPLSQILPLHLRERKNLVFTNKCKIPPSFWPILVQKKKDIIDYTSTANYRLSRVVHSWLGGCLVHFLIILSQISFVCLSNYRIQIQLPTPESLIQYCLTL